MRKLVINKRMRMELQDVNHEKFESCQGPINLVGTGSRTTRTPLVGPKRFKSIFLLPELGMPHLKHHLLSSITRRHDAWLIYRAGNFYIANERRRFKILLHILLGFFFHVSMVGL